MCKKWSVVYGDYIGKHLVSWCAYNGKDFSFLSDKQVGAKLRLGELVNGLMLDSEKNVVIDQEFTRNLLGKSGRAFTPIARDNDSDGEVEGNKYFALVKVVKGAAGAEYHFITNHCGYEVLNEEQVKAMMEVFIFGGIRMSDGGDLIIHSNIDVEDVAVCEGKPTKKAKGKQEGVTV